MTKVRWTFGAAVLILLTANLATTVYTHRQDDKRFDAQAAAIARDTRTTATSLTRIAHTVAANEQTVTGRLDRNWRMTIAARKAACEAFTAATPLPHYLYPSTCDEANMESKSYYVQFWRQPTGWNTAN